MDFHENSPPPSSYLANVPQARLCPAIIIKKGFIPDPLPVSIVYPGWQFLITARRKSIDHLIANAASSILYDQVSQ